MRKSTRPGKICVVIDTNVLIAAGLNKGGIPAQILEWIVLGRMTNCTSPQILEEVEYVLAREKFVKLMGKEECAAVKKMYVDSSALVFPSQEERIVRDDPSDDKFIHCAREAHAAYIISGDAHLLTVKDFQGIRIRSPRAFVKERA